MNTKYIQILSDYQSGDIDIARNEGTYKKTITRYSNPMLLIIDEFPLLKPNENDAKTSSSFFIVGEKNRQLFYAHNKIR